MVSPPIPYGVSLSLFKKGKKFQNIILFALTFLFTHGPFKTNKVSSFERKKSHLLKTATPVDLAHVDYFFAIFHSSNNCLIDWGIPGMSAGLV